MHLDKGGFHDLRLHLFHHSIQTCYHYCNKRQMHLQIKSFHILSVALQILRIHHPYPLFLG